MIAMIRLGVIGMIALSIIYILVSIYSRSVRREKLENRAAEMIAEGTLEETARDAYIEDGMLAYQSSLRRKLILGVFVVPVIAVAALIYVTNFM